MEMTASPRQQFLAWLEDQSFFDSIVISDEAALIRQAEEKVLTLFHQAAANVPAYKDFLKKSGINPADIRTMNDFRQLPLTDKKNYIILTTTERKNSLNGKLYPGFCGG